jgi:hypothetical protein
MAQEFGYASVGVVHDMCCENRRACRDIAPAPLYGEEPTPPLITEVVVVGGMLTLACQVLLVFAFCLLLRRVHKKLSSRAKE